MKSLKWRFSASLVLLAGQLASWPVPAATVTTSATAGSSAGAGALPGVGTGGTSATAGTGTSGTSVQPSNSITGTGTGTGTTSGTSSGGTASSGAGGTTSSGGVSLGAVLPDTSAGDLAAIRAALNRQITGYGTIGAVASSAPVSVLVVGPGSPGWMMPLLRGTFTVTNRIFSSAPAYVCPLGGTCTNGGVEVPIGTSRTFYVGTVTTTAPTVVALTTATLEITW